MSSGKEHVGLSPGPPRGASTGAVMTDRTQSPLANGRIIQIKNTALPLTLQCYGNAFYILDSNVALVIRSDKFASQTYVEQTGESFTTPFNRLFIESVAGSVPNSLGNSYPLYATYSPIKIWVGHDSHIGFLDKRIKPCLQSQLFLTAGGLITIPNGTTGLNVPFAYQAGWGVPVAFLVQNTDATHIIFMTDAAGTGMVAAIFPMQTIQLPIVAGAYPDSSNHLIQTYWTNTSGANVSFILDLIWRSNSVYMEVAQ